MSFVLTDSSTVDCSHGGAVQFTASNKLTVSGTSVLLLSDITGASITACGNPTNTQTGAVQCQTVATAMGVAQKLTVSSSGVALDTLTGTTSGNDPKTAPAPPTISVVTAKQTKLTAK